MSLEEIYQAIPHRPPILLLDRIVERGEKSIVCEKTFTGEEDFFQGHYPDYPIVPGVLLCEAAMQAGAIYISGEIGQDLEGKVPVATRMNDVRMKKMVRPGDTIRIAVELTETLSTAYYLLGKVTVDGKLAVRFEFACTLVDRPSD